MPETPELDRLTGQLYHLPDIIGRLGLSIAGAQKAFNADYIEQITRLVEITHGVIPAAEGSNADAADVLLKILEALAPPRYQFTETTIDFSADLAETLDVGIKAALGVGTKAITLNAGLTLGYGYDYRAAARLTSVIHARPVGPELAKDLLNRAKEVSNRSLALPTPKEVDQQIWDGLKTLSNFLTGTELQLSTEE